MKISIITASLLLLMQAFLFAVNAETDPEKFAVSMERVNKADTQLDMNMAAKMEYDRAEKTLRYEYSRILKKYSKNRLFIKRITAAQRAWLVYRGEYIESIFPGKNKSSAWGSMYAMSYNLEMARITWERVKDLHRWVKPDGSHGSFGQYR